MINIKPTDEELLKFAVEEEFLLFCDAEEFVDIARGVLRKYGAGTEGVYDVLRERKAHFMHEGRHSHELVCAALCYILYTKPSTLPPFWPWATDLWKPTDRRSNLVKAASLLLEEIDRLDSAVTPSWDSHPWPQVVQDSEGNWYGVREGWTMAITKQFKGDELTLLRTDGEFICKGAPNPDWRNSLQARPK